MSHLKLVIHDEKFMIDLDFVKEIVPCLKFIHHLNALDTFDGYINLRGIRIPVLDLSSLGLQVWKRGK